MAKDWKKEVLKLHTACLGITRQLAKSGNSFSIKVEVGRVFSFCMEAGKGETAQSHPAKEARTKKRKSQSKIARDRQRIADFLKKKFVDRSSRPVNLEARKPEKIVSDITVQEETQEVRKARDVQDVQEGGGSEGINNSNSTNKRGATSPILSGLPCSLTELKKKNKELLDLFDRVGKMIQETEMETKNVANYDSPN